MHSVFLSPRPLSELGSTSSTADARHVTYRHAGGEGMAILESMSLGGVRLRLPIGQTMPLGTRLDCEFAVPGSTTTIRVAAVVRWHAGLQKEVLGLQFAQGLRARDALALLRLS
jgi:PilZ domain